MADILKPDLCIIGGGATGVSLALMARERGASVVLVDRGAEPGDGNQQQLHRLAFLASAARAQAVRDAGRLGLDVEPPRPSFRVIAEHAAAVADAAMPRDAHERLTALGITVLSGTPGFTDRQTMRLGDTDIRAGHFVLATGSRPAIPALPGLDQVPYFTPDSILDNMRKLTHLLVIGGDATALELAQAYLRLGSAVSLVPQGEVLPGFDREAVAVLLRALAEEGLAVQDGAAVTAILPRSQGTGATIRHADGSEDQLDVSHVLVATGRAGDLPAGLLDKARLKTDPADPERVLVSPGGQTSSGRISAVGGAAGIDDPALAARQARIVLDRILGSGGGGKLDPLRVVRHVMTEPPLAQIGRVEPAAAARTGQTVLRANAGEHEPARARASALPGSLKLLVSGKGMVLGGAMVGHGALETMSLLALAMDRGLPLGQLSGLLLPDASPAAPLVDLARQAAGSKAPTPLARRLAALRRLLP